MKAVLGLFAVLLFAAAVALAFTLRPWIFPPKHEYKTGTFIGFRIGESKSNILEQWPNQNAVVTASGVQGWAVVSRITPHQKAVLLKENEWWLTEGANAPLLEVGCEPHSCPAATLHFREDKLNYAQVVCHRCP